MLGQSLVICDLQATHVRHHTIGAYYVIELPIFEAGVGSDPGEGFLYRPAETWLSAHMMERLIGTPIVLIDRDDETNVPEFPANVVGTILSARVEDEKCWATCRIISQSLADYLADAEDLTLECDLNILPGEDTGIETDFAIRVEPVPRLVNFITMALLTGEE
jgi:hypothetical protein